MDWGTLDALGSSFLFPVALIIQEQSNAMKPLSLVLIAIILVLFFQLTFNIV